MTGSTLVVEGDTTIEDYALQGVVREDPSGVPAIALKDPTNTIAAADIYPELRGLVLRCTLAFFPTRYAVDQPLNPPFDQVPMYARQAIAAAKSTGVFDHIEVRTPERTSDELTFREALDQMEIDPIAIGVADGRRFAIVRWGTDLPSRPRLIVAGAARGIRRRLLHSITSSTPQPTGW